MLHKITFQCETLKSNKNILILKEVYNFPPKSTICRISPETSVNTPETLFQEQSYGLSALTLKTFWEWFLLEPLVSFQSKPPTPVNNR